MRGPPVGICGVLAARRERCPNVTSPVGTALRDTGLATVSVSVTAKTMTESLGVRFGVVFGDV